MNWRPTRDLTIFVVGILGIIHETVIADAPDPQLIVLFGGMIGLPAFLARDRDQR